MPVPSFCLRQGPPRDYHPPHGKWYTAMWSRGVSFHVVLPSNKLFEILPTSTRLHQTETRCRLLPLYWCPLCARSPQTRWCHRRPRRTAFPGLRFFLIGDLGEQGFELYDGTSPS